MLHIYLTIFLAFVVLTLWVLLLYARWNYGVLEALNIPVVKRSLFMGSIPDLHLKVQHLEDIERFKKYGPIYGVYEGRSPQVHVCSPDLIRMILVKDFDYFHNRRAVDLGNALMNQMLDFLPVEPWRVLRQMQTPALTAVKIKQMSVSMEACVKEFVAYLNNQLTASSEGDRLKIDGRRTFVPMALDMLSSGIFGIRAENPCDYNNSFVQNMKNLMGEGQPPNILYTLSFSFPILNSLAPTIFSGPVNFFANVIRKVIKSREEAAGGGGRQIQNDFVGKLKDMMAKISTDEFKRLNINEDTVLAQAIGPLLAGYDAIATTSTFLTYFVASDEKIQSRLHKEIDTFFEKHGDAFSGENIGELEYLNACVKETLRLVPPFIRPERICTKDWEYNGIKISRGCTVMVPAWAANRNPEMYVDPDTFDPDRFLTSTNNDGNHDGSSSHSSSDTKFFTFGDGPRNCIGIKFAYDALKMSLCHVFKHFQFALRSDTSIKYKPGVLFLLQYEPIYLDMIRRNVNK